jgi:multicomponent Na+:H+ antiporter subunit D
MAVAPLTVAVPLLAAGALIVVGTRLTRAHAEIIALIAAIVVAVLGAILLAHSGSGLDVYWFGGWEPRQGIVIGVSFAVDAVGAGLATLVAGLTVMALVVTWRYRDTDAPHFQVLMLVFLAGMVGFCLSGDLFNMFVFFEVMSVAAFALAGYRVEEEEAVEGSLNFAVTNTIGSFLILTGIALVYGRTGSLNLAQVATALAQHPVDGLVVVAFALLVAGFLVKAAVVPFHFWLADAYAVAPTPVCILFAGAMSELGVYGVARLWFDSFAGALGPHSDSLGLVLIVAGSITAITGASMSLAQDHLKRLLAFATIAYVGVFLIGLGLLTPAGVAGAAIYVVADGFGKAALFGTVAIIQHRRGTVSAAALHGRGRSLGLVGAVFTLGALSFAAVPPFGTFLGKSLIEDELVKQGYGVVVAVLILTAALSSAAVLRAAAGIFLGLGREPAASRTTADEGEREAEEPRTRTPRPMLAPVLALLAGALVLGLIPGAVDGFQAAAERFVDGPAYAREVITGASVTLPEPPPYTTPVHSYVYAGITLALALIVAAAGLLRPGSLLRQASARVINPVRTLHSGHPGDYVAWLVAGVAALGAAFAVALT